MVSRYVKPEGICLFPPSHHYRMMPPQRAEGFSVPNQQGAYGPPPPQQQQQQQQGPPGGLRGIAQAQSGAPPPPNQAPTPPNAADQLKVQTMQQQQPPSMNHIQYVQQQVRPPAATYYPRPAGPPNQGQRMQSHNSRPQQQQQMYAGPAQPQYVLQQPVYITSNSGVQYAGYPAQRPPYVQQIATSQAVFGPPIAAYTPYNANPNPPNQVYNLNNYYSTPVVRHPPAPPVNPNNPAGQNVPMAAVPMAAAMPPPLQQPFQRQPPNRRRANALPIIDPTTGADRLQEIFEDSSHPPSGDSSARQTPQPPSAAQNSHNKEVQATFAKQVMQALEERPQDPPPHDQQQQQHHHPQAPPPSEVAQQHHPVVGPNHLAEHVQQQPQVFVPAGVTLTAPPPPHHQLSKMEHVVQSSKLQPCAKEFVLPTPSLPAPTTAAVIAAASAKETPIVSANCDAVEVTLPNKLPKDRESPAKGRAKPRADQPLPPSQVRERGDSSKEAQAPQAAVEKEVVVPPVVKDEVKPVLEQQPPAVEQAEPPAAVPPPPAVQPPPKEVPKEPQQPDKKKKDSSKAEVSVAAPPQQPAQTQDGGSNAKKQNAQRSASKQQQQQQQQKQPAVAAVAVAVPNKQKGVATPVTTAVPAAAPLPQPPKTASKAHKKHELNQKGANKEGTDMDAFNDNVRSEEEVNSNVIPAIEDTTPTITAPTITPTPNDIINANSTVDIPASVTIENSRNVVESTPPPQVVKPAPEPTVKKSSFDITSIVREKPKPFVSPAPAPAGGQDEPDRAAVVGGGINDKLVQAKNEANAKTAGGLDNKLPYKDGQWSPANQAGLKVYQRDFLLSLKDLPASRKTPDNIPDVIFMIDDNNRGRLSDGRSSMGGRSDFTPSFNYGGKSSSQRGVVSKRPSQGKMDGRGGGGGGGNSGSMSGGANKSSKPLMKVSISVREDVKLHETENAWRPARFKKGEAATDDDKRTEELYKKVRGVLNKLTPQKFETLLAQIKGLPIDTSARLQGVIDLVFEKAVDEPNFSVAYANMCKELALMQVPTNNSTPDKQEFVNFRKLLITRCQVEFEKNSIDEVTRNNKVKEIEETTDPEKKKDLQFDLEDYDRRLRMKSVGNIRFIGELFKQNMLTVNIMMRCLANLLENKDEESLECLCKLLTTIGKELESNKQVNLQPIFGPMRDIITKKEHKVSSRIRFMLQDVLDLRHSKWVPRRQDFNPKTIDQITKEAADEHLNIQIMNSGPMPQQMQQMQQQSRKDDRMGGNDRRGGSGGGRGGNKVGDEGWITMGNNKGRTNDRYTGGQNERFTFQKDKLKTTAPMADEPLGTPSMFGRWGKGSVVSNTKAPTQQMLPNTTNMYAPLDNMDGDKRGMNSRPGYNNNNNKDSYHSKGNSLERYNPKYDGRGSRSSSQHRSHEGGAPPAQRSMGPPPSQQRLPAQQPVAAQPVAAPVPVQAVAEPQPVAVEDVSRVMLSEDQIHRRITNSLDEFVSGNCSVEEYFQEISTDIPSHCIKEIIRDSYLHVLEKNSNARLTTGSLFAALVSQGQIQLEDYCVNLEDVLSQVEDLMIDIPKIWDYLAELMVDLLCMEAVPLKRLHKSCIILIGQRQADRLLAPLFKLVVSKKGPNFLQSSWSKSGLQLADFMDSSLVQSFISDNQLEFLVGGATSAGQSQLSYEDIQQKMLEFLRANSNIDEISNWITANVGDRVKENKFIRSLSTAIFQDSIDEEKKCKLNKERLAQHITLLIKYVDHREEYELQCLYALQALINRMEHPSGLLLQIFETIYELLAFSQEAFMMWETSVDPAEQEGKGVALKQLTSFFTQLKENIEDEDEEGEEEEESSGSEGPLGSSAQAKQKHWNNAEWKFEKEFSLSHFQMEKE
ncbi:unnamed protein product [Phaedon cochleariae]|uniref:Uncharacterized protein n=1 Tax=Phaedon cochleariae TaxID=80249 RepID=A0A9P0GVH6_PHACE|nr:unnamed protein product [Phaedon cochleariae]